MYTVGGFLYNDTYHLTSSSEQSWKRHFGGQCQRVLFSEMHIFRWRAVTRKPIDHQHGERGISRHVWRACEGSIDHIEYDVTVQISALQDRLRVSACVCACLCRTNQTGSIACCVFLWSTRLDAHTVWPTGWRLFIASRACISVTQWRSRTFNIQYLCPARYVGLCLDIELWDLLLLHHIIIIIIIIIIRHL